MGQTVTQANARCVIRRDSPSEQNLSSVSKPVHQLHHAPVVVHIQGHLLVGLDMGQSETVPDLNLAARSRA